MESSGGQASADGSGIAEVVGARFLVEYYKTASENTAQLHRFYRKNAACSFGDGVSFYNSAEIATKLAVLSGARFDLETGGVTCVFQSTAEGNVLVMVSGLVSLRDESGKFKAPRRFVQTFLLVRKDGNTYAIANDLHRFVDTTQDQKAVVVEAPSTTVASQQQPQAPVEAKKEDAVKPVVQEKPAAAKEEKPAKSQAPLSPQVNNERRERSQPKSAQKQQQQPPAAEKKENAPAASAPAAPAQAPVQPPAPAKPSGPPSYSQVAAKSSPQHKLANGTPAASASVKDAAGPKKDAPKESAPARVTSPPSSNASVYVKNGASVPQKALTDLLTSAFGPISSVTVKGSAVVVTMTSAKDAENVVAAKEIVVEGQTLQLELSRGGSSSRGGQKRGGDGASGSKRSSSSNANAGGAKPASDKPAAKPQQQSSSNSNSNSGGRASAQQPQKPSGSSSGAASGNKGGAPRGGKAPTATGSGK